MKIETFPTLIRFSTLLFTCLYKFQSRSFSAISFNFPDLLENELKLRSQKKFRFDIL